jgi:hypothetical protein
MPRAPPTLGSLGPSHQWRHKSWVSLRGPPCVHGVGALLMRRRATGVLVVGDVLEHCLVVGCVLTVVRLEVRLIEGLLPWSSGKSERRICSTLRKLITSVN